MKKIILIVILAIALLVFIFFPDGEKEIENIGSTGTSIIAFGNSLVEGVGSTGRQDFVSILSERIDEDIINLGVSGNTTADGLKRVQSVVELNPKIVIVLLGGNDAIRNVSAEETFQNLREIIDTIHDRGSAVILVGIQRGILRDSNKKEFKKLAEELNTGFVPDILDDLFGNSSLMSDPIHPNNAGYAIIADRIEPVLREILEL